MTTTMRARSGRARPMPPDERRAHIVAATLPLLREHGANATTRQIAEAAGVAEGTLFRVFPDKDAIIDAAVAEILDPWSMVAVVRGIADDLPLEQKLTAAVAVFQGRIAEIIDIMMLIGKTAPARLERTRQQRSERDDPITAAVHDLLVNDAAAFRVDIDEVVRLLRLLVFAGTHPWITEGKPLDPGDIVGVILDGVRARPTVEHPDDRTPHDRTPHYQGRT